MKKLNVLMVVLSSVNPDVRVEKEARYLASEGHNVVVIGINKNDSFKAEEMRDGYIIKRVNIKQKLFFKYFEFWKKVKKLVGNEVYDIIHLHDLNVLPLVSRLKKNSNCFVYDSHENFPEQMSETFGIIAYWVYTFAEKHYIKKVQAVITAGKPVSDNLERKYKLETSYICNYPSMIDVDKSLELEIPEKYKKEKPFRIVSFGVMYANLGYEKMVEGAKILSSKYSPDQIEFFIMGSGPAYEPMKQKIEELEVSEYFTLTGWMDYKLAFQLLRTSDVGLILFQPGKNNFLRVPNRLYEYFATGLPFIGSNFEGLKTGTNNNPLLGKLIDPTDPNELAKEIEYLISNTEDLQKMKEAVILVYKEEYCWEKTVEKIIPIYEKALESKK